jgi:hypothetical protein
MRTRIMTTNKEWTRARVSIRAVSVGGCARRDNSQKWRQTGKAFVHVAGA